MKPVSVKPSLGGRLMPDVSSGNAGIYNYTVKRDWRRVLDREIRAEGHVKFAPNASAAELGQAYPPDATGSITVIAEALLPSGMIYVICGTPTQLWAYTGLSDPTYVLGSASGEYIDPADTYFNDNPADWALIGSGFSTDAQRWESVPVGSWLVLNNGVDLPVTYRAGESSVSPIHELREQGISSVGTIAETNGILCCMDIRQMSDEALTDLMSPIEAAVDGELVGVTRLAALASISGNTLTADTAVFDVSMTGRTIRMANGVRRVITFVSDTVCTTDGAVVTVTPDQPLDLLGDDGFDNRVTPAAATLFPDLVIDDSLIGRELFWGDGNISTITDITGGYFYVGSDRTIPLGAVSIENPLAYASFTGVVERRQSRKIWSMPNLPRRWASIIPCTVDPNSNAVTLTYPVKSLKTGMSVMIVGAGAGGNNLTATILMAYPNVILLADSAITDVSSDVEAAIAAAVAWESTALTIKESTASTLSTAQAALDAAAEASDSQPDDKDLKKAEADASAAVDVAQAAARQATTDYTNAQATTAAARAAAQPTETTLVAADAEASIAGLFEDLEGDGSAIVRALKLGSYLVIYKESGSIFMARYTGNLASPFVYDEIKVPFEGCLPTKHRSTLISLNDVTHLYAGSSDFYQFNTTMRLPQIFEPLRAAKGVFFDAAGTGKFACNNAVTRELMFCCPDSQTSDKALCFDYLYNTSRTTGAAWTSGASVRRPKSVGYSVWESGDSLDDLVEFTLSGASSTATNGLYVLSGPRQWTNGDKFAIYNSTLDRWYIVSIYGATACYCAGADFPFGPWVISVSLGPVPI